ncbi:MAG TPA: aminoacyl-histidine dipeptidase [Bacteroidales bacterium]|jgi:dipeptidase D|nr:aminoacyl-histidine dipeptidase [Bacteroidales bacterium]
MLEKLNPSLVWKYFEEILAIPRPSKKEEKIIAYLEAFAKKNKLEYKIDKAGNVLISKSATKGFDKLKTVVLQSHVDMVCEKNSNSKHNFDTDPIIPVIDGDWLKAKETTLGADNGIGVATQLALLASKEIEHGPIECLFTVDEETGLTGAFALKPGFFNGKILINLDSEDEGEIFIGCAGGKDTVAILKYEPKKAPGKQIPLKLTVSGLRGGHSGDDINKGYANAVKLLTRILFTLDQKYGIKLSAIDGGNLRNAIAREAYAVFYVTHEKVSKIEKEVELFFKAFKEEYKHTEENINVQIEKTSKAETIIDRKTQPKLLQSLYACPHGVIAMSMDMPGLVETSTNLASVKMKGKNKIEITTSQRSSVESAKADIVNMVECALALSGAEVKHSNGYPGWKPNPKSPILEVSTNVYKKLFKKEAKVKAIHAGLECGLFLEKYPELDMISIGPTMRGVHSPDEKLEIPSVEKFWKFLTEILINIPLK